MKKIFLNQNWPIISFLIIFTMFLAIPIYYYRVTFPVDSDFGSKIRVASEFLQTHELSFSALSHPILPITLAFMYWLTRSQLSLYNSLIVLQVAFHLFIVLVLYFWFGVSERKNWDWIRAAAAITLSFVAPIMLFAPLDGNYYFGYIGMANYHNPTIHMLKPFALISLIFGINAIEGKESAWWEITLAFLAIVIGTWIKPNYALVILPGIALAGAFRLYQKRKLGWKMLILGFYVPAVASLFAQWLIAYVFGEPGEGIILAPFVVESAFSDWLFLKFILSALFPLLILWIARKDLLKDSALLVGWTAFLVGITQNYVLAEGGERLMHGNFRWSGQIALFLLFAIALRWFLQEKMQKGNAKLWEKISAYGIYALHLAGGIVYYIYCMISISYR